MMRKTILRLLGLGIVMVLARPASGTGLDTLGLQDSSWLPWIGCWDGASEVGGDEANALLVCFEPIEGTAGVNIRSYTAGELVSVAQMVADGVARETAEGGCIGTQTARW